MTTLIESVDKIRAFQTDDLRLRLAAMENELVGAEKQARISFGTLQSIESDLLGSALMLKAVSGQIDVIIHAVAIILLLPHILDDNEKIESLSLGAGNTGKPFDLVTNRRVAEFKFIRWRGGSESIRQNNIFKDFYNLAEANTTKERYLYVVGIEHPLKFLNKGRSLSSVLSKEVKLLNEFRQRYGEKFSVVREYYLFKKDQVNIVDVLELDPDLAALFTN